VIVEEGVGSGSIYTRDHLPSLAIATELRVLTTAAVLWLAVTMLAGGVFPKNGRAEASGPEALLRSRPLHVSRMGFSIS